MAMNTFAEIIDSLGGPAAVARGLGRSLYTVTAWRRRDSIPAKEWEGLIRMADERGVDGLTFEAFNGALKRREEVA